LLSVNGTAISARLIRAVPVVVGVKGGKVGFGGKYGPQIAGSLVNGTLSASGATPGGLTFALTGSRSGGALGRFSMTKGSVSLLGEYVLDPVTATTPAETVAATGSTSGFAAMTPASFGWNNTTTASASLSTAAPSTTGYSNGTAVAFAPNLTNFAAASQAVQGMATPGLQNTGPNLGGTSVSGWFADDIPGPTPIDPSQAGNPNSTTTTKDPTPIKTFDTGSGSTSTDTSLWDKAKAWWNGFNLTSGTAAGTGKKEGNPMDDGSHDAGTSGSGLNFGHFPTAGGDTPGLTSNGTAPLNRPLGQGDNPFDVASPGDILNASHLINGASDPLVQGLAR
jgi:hypothetical protein